MKKRVVQLDQENAKLESYKSEKDKVIKQLLEIADDLARKIKKDPNDTILQNSIIIFFTFIFYVFSSIQKEED